MPPFTLPARCDRTTVEALLPELAGISSPGPIRIDATAVTHVGQALLQLLVSARRSGEGAVIDASPTLLEAARLTGLTMELFDEERT
jgi:anti-anti-sigma regulatory factor